MKWLAVIFLWPGLAVACAGADAKVPVDPACEPESYSAGLVACSAVSPTLRDSIGCENYWRQRCRRPLRALPRDAGADS